MADEQIVTPANGDAKVIKVTKKNVVAKDGHAFTAWETTDKHGRRVSVRFCNGTPVPETTTYIALTDAWMDKRYTFPLLRIRQYAQVAEVHDVKPEDELPF